MAAMIASEGSAMVETNERLARVQRSIAEVEADGRPARLKIALLTALRRERDALSAAQGVDLPATEKPSKPPARDGSGRHGMAQKEP
jgi:hypothetical protein